MEALSWTKSTLKFEMLGCTTTVDPTVDLLLWIPGIQCQCSGENRRVRGIRSRCTVSSLILHLLIFLWSPCPYLDSFLLWWCCNLHQACLLPSFYGGAWKPQSFYSLHSGRSPDLWGTNLRPDQEGPEVKKPLKFSLRLLFFHSLL